MSTIPFESSKAHKFLDKKMLKNENYNAFKVLNKSKVFLFQKAI
jgi:hypothetical protein